MKIVFFLILSLLLLSCTFKELKKEITESATGITEIVNYCPPKHTINPISITSRFEKSITFHLGDSLVLTNYTKVQYLPKINHLAVLDNYFNRVIFFDLSNQQKKSTIAIDSEDIRREINGFSVLSRDSILLFTYADKAFYIVNSDGELTDRFSINYSDMVSSSDLRGSPSPSVENGSPFYVANNELMFVGYLFGEHQKEDYNSRFIRGRVNLSTGYCISDVTYSPIYQNTNWGGDYYRIPYYCMLPDGEQLISLPAEHKILSVNQQNHMSLKNGSSPNVGCINSMEISKGDLLVEIEKDDHLILKHYLSNFSYKNVIYLPTQDIILRVIEYPVRINNDKPGVFKKSSFLAFNRDFDFLDEIDIPANLSTSNYFITSEGIYLLNLDQKDETYAKYTLLSFDNMP